MPSWQYRTVSPIGTSRAGWAWPGLREPAGRGSVIEVTDGPGHGIASACGSWSRTRSSQRLARSSGVQQRILAVGEEPCDRGRNGQASEDLYVEELPLRVDLEEHIVTIFCQLQIYGREQEAESAHYAQKPG